MKTALNRYPTVEELRALELAARRARARELARLLRSGAKKMAALAEHLFTLPGGGRMGHA
jgi:hypothetical protein